MNLRQPCGWLGYRLFSAPPSVWRLSILCLAFFLSKISISTLKAQCFTPYNLQNPVLISGTAGQVGAVYKFANVADGLDMHISIAALSNAFLTKIDTAGTGYARAWQPVIGTTASNGYIEWILTFKVAGTNTNATPSCATATGIDIDGATNAGAEFIAVKDYTSYNVTSPTSLTLVNSLGWLTATGPQTTFAGIDTSARTVLFQVNYDNISSFSWRTGITRAWGCAQGPECGRLFSLYFEPIVTCQNVTSGGSIGNAQTGCAGLDPTAFTNVTAPSGGSGVLEYYWMQNTVSAALALDDSRWSIVSGATAATYDPPSLSQTTHFVRMARRNTCGTYKASNVVSVTLSPNISITAQPTGLSACVGNTSALSFTATGGTPSLSYQWQSSPDGSSLWTNILTATGTTYTPPSVLAGTTYYRALISATGAGCTTTATNVVAAEIGATPSVTATVATTQICQGATVLMQANAQGGAGSCTIQWQSSPISTTSWSNMAGVTGSNMTIPSSNLGSTKYRAVYNCSGLGCCN